MDGNRLIMIVTTVIFFSQKPALDKYLIHKTNFDQLFIGSPPEFPSSKKLMKTSISPGKSLNKSGSSLNKSGSTLNKSGSKLNKSAKKPSPDKKGRQESMDKFVKKTDKTEGRFYSI